MQAYFILTIVILGAVLGSSAIAAEPGCVRPNAQKLVEQWRNDSGDPVEIDPDNPVLRASWDTVDGSSLLVVKRDDQPPLQWLGVSWNRPKAGAVFVLDCNGKPLAAYGRLMSVLLMRKGPTLPAIGPTIEVLSVSLVGTGAFVHSIRLMAFVDGAIIVLWDTIANESIAFGDMAEFEDTFSWKSAEEGGVIAMTGTRLVGSIPDREYGWPANTTHRLPDTTSCWTPAEKKYTPCPMASPAVDVKRGCKNPDVQATVDRWRKDTGDLPRPREYDLSDLEGGSSLLTQRRNAPPLQWLGMSWNDSKGGAVFVFDCTSRSLAARALPSVLFLRQGPTLPGIGPTVEAFGVPEGRNSAFVESVALLAYSNDAILLLWQHVVGANVESSKTDHDDRFSWRIAGDGQVIRVSGTRSVREKADHEHGWAPNTTHELPDETWCWTPAEKKYAECPGKPTAR